MVAGAGEERRDESQGLPPAPAGPADAAVRAKADKAYWKAYRKKAMRPWYKKKRFIVPLALAAAVGLSAALAGPEEETPTAAPAVEEPAVEERHVLFPDRPDRQRGDQEAALGGSVDIAGWVATVTGAEITTDFPDGEQLTVFVEIENRGHTTRPYRDWRDWRIQDAAGRVVNAVWNFRDDALGSGNLLAGGTVSGTIAFEAPAGTYFVIYQPDPFDAARGIWGIEL